MDAPASKGAEGPAEPRKLEQEQQELQDSASKGAEPEKSGQEQQDEQSEKKKNKFKGDKVIKRLKETTMLLEELLAASNNPDRLPRTRSQHDRVNNSDEFEEGNADDDDEDDPEEAKELEMSRIAVEKARSKDERSKIVGAKASKRQGVKLDEQVDRKLQPDSAQIDEEMVPVNEEMEQEPEAEAGDSDLHDQLTDQDKSEEPMTDEHDTTVDDDALKISRQSISEEKMLAVKKPRRHLPTSSARHNDDFKKSAGLEDWKLNFELATEADPSMENDGEDDTAIEKDVEMVADEGVVKETEQEQEAVASDFQDQLAEDDPDEPNTGEYDTAVDDDALKMSRQSISEGKKLAVKKPVGGKARSRHTPTSSTRHMNDFKKIAGLAERKLDFDQATEADPSMENDVQDDIGAECDVEMAADEGVVKETEQLAEGNPDDDDEALKISRQSISEGKMPAVKKPVGGKAGSRHTPTSSVKHINDFKKAAGLDFDQITEANPIMENDGEDDTAVESQVEMIADEGVVKETQQELEAGGGTLQDELVEDKLDEPKTDEYDTAVVDKALKISSQSGKKLAVKKSVGSKAGSRHTPISSARHMDDFKKTAGLVDTNLDFDQTNEADPIIENDGQDDTAVESEVEMVVGEGAVKETEQEHLLEAGESDLQDQLAEDKPDDPKTDEHDTNIVDEALKISRQSIGEEKKLGAKKPVGGKARSRHTPTSSARHMNDFEKITGLADRKLDFDRATEADPSMENDGEDDTAVECDAEMAADEGVVKEIEQAVASDFEDQLAEDNPDEPKTGEYDMAVVDEALKISRPSINEGKKLAVKKPVGSKAGRRHTPTSSARHANDFKKIAGLEDRKLNFDETTKADPIMENDGEDDIAIESGVEIVDDGGVMKETEQELQAGESDLQDQQAEDKSDELKTDQHDTTVYDDALNISNQSLIEGNKLAVKKPVGGKVGRRHPPTSSATNINDFKKTAVLADRKLQLDSSQQYFDQTTAADPIIEGDRELTEDNLDECQEINEIDELKDKEHDIAVDDGLEMSRQSISTVGNRLAGSKDEAKKEVGGKGRRGGISKRQTERSNLNYFNKNDEKLQPDSAQQDFDRERVIDEDVGEETEQEQMVDESNLQEESQGTRSQEEENNERETSKSRKPSSSNKQLVKPMMNDLNKNSDEPKNDGDGVDDEDMSWLQDLGDLDTMGIVQKLGFSWFNKWSNAVEKLVERNTELVYALQKKNNSNKGAHFVQSKDTSGDEERKRRVGTSEKAGKEEIDEHEEESEVTMESGVIDDDRQVERCMEEKIIPKKHDKGKRPTPSSAVSLGGECDLVKMAVDEPEHHVLSQPT